MIVECTSCRGSGRNPVWQCEQCIECHGTGTITEQGYDDVDFAKAVRPIYQRAIAAAEAQENAQLALELEIMADMASAGFEISQPQEASLRAAAKALRKVS